MIEQKEKVNLQEFSQQQHIIQYMPDQLKSKISYVIDIFPQRNTNFQIKLQLKKNKLLFLVKLKQEDRISIMDFYLYDNSKILDSQIDIYKNPLLNFPQRIKNYITAQKRYKHLYDRKRNLGIFIVQFPLGRLTLSEALQQYKKTSLQKQFIVKLIKDLVQQLCYYHSQNLCLVNISIQNIVISNSNKFIIIPDKESIYFAQNQGVLSGKTVFQCTQQNDAFKNLFKLEVYKLGKLIQDALKQLKYQFNKKFYIRECIIIQKKQDQEKYIYLSDVLQIMLNLQQNNRLSSFQMMLYLGQIDWIKKLIQIPFQKYFNKKLIKTSTSCSCIRIKYYQIPIQIDAQLDEQIFKKSDAVGKQITTSQKLNIKNGIIYFQGNKVYEGQFIYNQPSGKCKINYLNKWIYQGQIQNYQLINQGTIFFGNQIISKGSFTHSLNMNKFDRQIDLIVGNMYYIDISNNITNKIYCKYINSSNVQINLSNLTCESSLILLIKNLGLKNDIKEIKLSLNILNNTYSFTRIDMIQLKFKVYTVRIGLKLGLGNKIFISLLNQKIQKIDLSNCQNLRHEQIKTLICLSNKLQNLLEIDLTNTKTNDNIFINFLEEKKKLQSVHISNTLITDHGLIYLLYSKINKIRLLKINNLKIQNTSVIERIINSDKCKYLQILQLQGLNISNKNIIKISSLKQTKLKNINLSKCNFLTDKGLQDFFTYNNLQQLSCLNLSHTNITNKVIQLIAQLKNGMKLRSINLSGCINIKSKVLKELIKSQKVQQIQQLDLSSSNLNDQCLNQLKDNKFKSLKKLVIHSCYNITQKGLFTFLNSNDVSTIQSLNLSKLKFSSNIFSNQSKTRFSNLKQMICFSIQKQQLQVLSGFQLLQQISIQSSQLSRDHTIQHFKWMRKLLNLKKISIWAEKQLILNLLNEYLDKIEFKWKGFQYLADQIKSNKNQSLSEQTQNLIKLSKQPIFQKLQTLNLSNQYNIDQNKITQIFATTYAKNIQTIDISQSCFGSKFIQAILNNNRVHPLQRFRLKHLNLSQVKDNIEQIFSKVIKSGILDEIQTLNLSWTFIYNNTLQCLALQDIKTLKELNLNNIPYITDCGVQAIVNSSLMDQLVSLDLRYTNITNKTLQTLSNNSNIKKLTFLYLGSCQNVNMVGLRYLFSSNILKNLKVLDIGWVKVDNSLFQILNKKHNLSLKKLILPGVKNCWQYLGQFIESKTFQQLQVFDLSFTTVKDKYLVNFLSLKHSHLCNLIVGNSLVTKSFEQKIQKLIQQKNNKKSKYQSI